jgi:hypothetical protein
MKITCCDDADKENKRKVVAVACDDSWTHFVTDTASKASKDLERRRALS